MLLKLLYRIDALEKELHDAMNTIQTRDATIEELENAVKQKLHEIEMLTAAISDQEAEFQREANIKTEEMKLLSEYERSYREIQELFYKFDTSEKDPDEKKSESEIIQEQLVTIINVLLEDQESFFDKYNSKVLKDDSDQPSDYIAFWHKKYILIRESFLNSCETVLKELKLLTSHISHEKGKEAEEQDDTLDDSNESNNNISISNLFADGKDPFSSSERLTAKYSASLEVSTNDCCTFTLLPGSQVCKACKATVFICPHTFHTPQALIKLPPHTTHLQITRPLMMPEPLDCLNMVQIEIEKTPCEELRGFKRRLSLMWRMCREQKYHIPRDLTESFISNLIEQFYLYISNDEGEVEYKSFLEHFIDFILGLYQMQELVELVLIDVLSAISKYAEKNHFIALFGMCLGQTVDPIVFQYIYLVNDILLNTDLVCTFDLRPILLELYPFLSDEDIDPHMLSYSSQANNRISSYLVSKYIMKLIVSEKEPRMVECLTKLKQNSVSHPEIMNFKEFCSVMETIYPLATPTILEDMFLNSLVNSRKNNDEDKVPTKFLSQIAAYLQLQSVFPAIITGRLYALKHPRVINAFIYYFQSALTQRIKLLTIYKIPTLKMFLRVLNTPVYLHKVILELV